MTETYTDFCIRIGALNKLQLAKMYDNGTVIPPEINQSADNHSQAMKKNYQIKECAA